MTITRLSPAARGRRSLRFAALLCALVLLVSYPHPSNAGVKALQLCTEAGLLAEIAATPDNGTIRFECGATTVTLSQTLVFERSLRLEGDGLVTLARTGDGRLATIGAGTTLELAGLTLSGGAAPQGGALFNQGTLLLEDVLLADNRATTGGAIYSTGRLEAQRTTFERNRATADGGALASIAPGGVTLNDVVFDDNSATGRGGAITADGQLTLTKALLRRNAAADGGGLALPSGVATLQDSELSGNRALAAGGGIWSTGALTVTGSAVLENSAASAAGIHSAGPLTVHSSTVSGNRATGDGGGIASFGNTLLSGATIAFNSATGSGGGVHQSSGTVTVRGTLLAGNSADAGPDCLGALTSAGGNLLQRSEGCDGAGSNDRVNVEPLLLPLANNGGPGRTHALAPGSPAADAVSAGDCAELVDQRGVNRPVNAACDIGAYELGFVVNSLADAADLNPAANTCDSTPNQGVCTLRAAIQQANNLFGRQAITFAVDGTFLLDPLVVTNELDGVADLDITQDLIISGNGVSRTIIDGGSDAAVGGVLDIASGASVELSGLSLTGGNAGASLSGGALRNAGNVTLADSAVFDSRTSDSSGRGGGIENSGTLWLTRVTVSGNTAGGGAGIDNTGTLFAADSTISDNHATSAVVGGGGINTRGVARLSNVTLSGNSAALNGGGIAVTGGGGDALRLNNVTVTANTANADADQGGDGGGVFVLAGSADVLLANTVLAGNTDGGGAARPDCAGALVSLGYNLIGINSDCAVLSREGDRLGTAAQPLLPRLGPLRENGGPTRTHAVLTGSPALDGGSSAVPGGQGNACAAADQRGVARPIGARCDIGASEVPLADLRLGLAPPPAPALELLDLTYGVIVDNVGPSAATDIVVRVTLPRGTVLIDVRPADMLCSTADETVTCTIAELASGERVSLAIGLRAAPGPAASNANVIGSEADPAPANNAGAIQFAVERGVFLPLVAR